MDSTLQVAPSTPLLPQPGPGQPEHTENKPNEPYQIAFEPELVPPLSLMRQEGIQVLEEWFRWGEEWSMLLRLYGGLGAEDAVLEIGCGLGRVAFPLRYVLSARGSYDGFDISESKISFLKENFQKAYSNFRFKWADVHNTHYNPEGKLNAATFRFPYPNRSFDLVFAASVFTHTLPAVTRNYFQEAFRVLRPGGLCVFSFFLLDNYKRGRPRPSGFAGPAFNFDLPCANHEGDVAIVDFANPEYMVAYSQRRVEQYAEQAGLKIAEPPLVGMWSGRVSSWLCPQDLVVLTKE